MLVRTYSKVVCISVSSFEKWELNKKIIIICCLDRGFAYVAVVILFDFLLQFICMGVYFCLQCALRVRTSKPARRTI